MTFDIELRTEQFLNIAKEIDAIAIEIQLPTQDAQKYASGARLHALSRCLRELSAEVAAEVVIDIGQCDALRESLAASERQFSALAENLPDNIARWDCFGRYLYLNPTHERTLCQPAVDVIGTQIDGVHEEVIAAIARVVATGEALLFVRQTVRDDTGSARMHEVSLFPEWDEKGQIVGVLGIGRDVTQQVQMEDALAASERQFRTVAENLPNNLARHAAGAEVVYVNPRLADFLGFEFHEVIGTTPTQLFPDGRFAEYESVVLETARTGMDGQLEFRFTMESGQIGIHQIHTVAERDETGVVVSVLAIGFDITERRQAEQDLKRAFEFTKGIIAAIPDILFELDRDGRYLNTWTRNPDLLVGHAEALLGRTLDEVLPAKQASVAMRAIQAADRQGVTYGHTTSFDMPDGSPRWFEHSVAKKPGETRATDTFLVLSRDVTARTQAEQALDTARSRLHSVLQTIPDMVWLKDAGGTYLACNHAFERMFDKRAVEIIGKTDYDIFDAKDAELFREKDRAAIEARRICINEEWVTCPGTGEGVLVEKRKMPLFDADGNVTGVLGVGRDITERKNIEQMLASREQEFRTLVEHSPDIVMRYGRDLRRLYVNPTFASLVEGGEAVLIGKKPLELPGVTFSTEYEKQLDEVFRSGKGLEFEVQWGAGDGATLACYQMKLVPELDAHGAVDSVLAVGRDITELHVSRQKIHHMAFYDALTSLPNRALFNERLQQTIADASALRLSAGVMMIDMDRFKSINDTMGHSVGDELLREAATRLLACVRVGDTVARFGGDEFAILLPDIRNRRVLEDISTTIIERFDQRFVLNGKEVFVSCSIGVALYPVDSAEVGDLMKYADSAMYLAKRSGRRSFRFYSKELTADATTRLLLESELRRAIERHELELYYQPKVLLCGNEVLGSEALLRWRRPGIGLVPPSQFIPIAEETGLIADLGEWVLREACRTAVEWNGGGIPLHRVAINLSARQFQFRNLVSLVKEVLDNTGCRPEWIELEITESLLLEEGGSTLDTLSALRSMGLAIAIDDFGTGYSALSYLARFPIDTLKIDKSFVQKMTTDQRHAELVKAILLIAQCLGQQVVAEGVETVEQAVFLRENGCQVAQGYLYSKPLPKLEMAMMPRYLGLDAVALRNAESQNCDALRSFRVGKVPVGGGNTNHSFIAS